MAVDGAVGRARKRKWIQRAIKRPGAMTEWCKQRGYDGVTDGCLAEAKAVARKRKDKTLMGRAVLAERFRKGDLSK